MSVASRLRASQSNCLVFSARAAPVSITSATVTASAVQNLPEPLMLRLLTARNFDNIKRNSTPNGSLPVTHANPADHRGRRTADCHDAIALLWARPDQRV